MTEHDHILREISAQREAAADRRREIARAIEALQAEDQRLLHRDSELQVTERTIATLLPTAPDAPQPLGDLAASVVTGLEPEKKRQQRKPDHLPPVLQMADEALAHFEEEGHPWCTARDIAKFISAHYWPEAKADLIQGQLWRAADRGDLLKRGSCYARKTANNEEGLDTDVSRPLQTNGATDWSSEAPRG